MARRQAPCFTILGIGAMDVLVAVWTSSSSSQAGKRLPLTMNKITMKFVSIEETLSGLRSSFKQFDTDCSGFIDYEEPENAVNGIGCTCDDTLLKQSFAEPDFNENQKLDFKEFIVALALACLLKVIPEEVANSKLELIHAERTPLSRPFWMRGCSLMRKLQG
jgi:hypothetical protein